MDWSVSSLSRCNQSIPSHTHRHTHTHTCSPGGSGNRWSVRCSLLAPRPPALPQQWLPGAGAECKRCDRGSRFDCSHPAGTEESMRNKKTTPAVRQGEIRISSSFGNTELPSTLTELPNSRGASIPPLEDWPPYGIWFQPQYNQPGFNTHIPLEGFFGRMLTQSVSLMLRATTYSARVNVLEWRQPPLTNSCPTCQY